MSPRRKQKPGSGSNINIAPPSAHLEIKGQVPNAFLVRAGKTKHGPRRHWREWEYAQFAIQTLYGPRPPKNVNRSKLTHDINDWLRRNPDYQSTGLGPISRTVVLRVLDLLHNPS